MRFLISLVQAFLLLFVLNISAQAQQWFKGNLHTHSYWSDGDEFPEVIMEWYKDHDYQFVALSDHNILAEGTKTKKITGEPLYLEAFRKYLKRYGKEWVNYREIKDGYEVRLKTLAEFRPRFEEKGKFLILQAEEVTSYLDGKALHMGAVNIDSLIRPRQGATVVEVLQNNLDAIKAHGKQTGKPVLQHLNHPNFTYAITAHDIIHLDGERFFEVFNGHPYVNNYGDSLHDGTETMWDKVNIAYHSLNKPLLLGIATDDSHHYHKFGSEWSNAGRGWVEVRASELSANSIITSLQSGDFYASTGVALSDLAFDGKKLSIEVKKEKGALYEIQFIGVKNGKTTSEILKKVKAEKASYEIPDDVLFVRAKIISDKLKKNPYKVGDTEVAWTQPVRKN